MARIRSIRPISVERVIVGESQVRIRNADKQLEDLAESIKLHGMLEPIVVCVAGDPNKFEVLMGQRRVLAHRLLGRSQILAAIIDEPVDLATAKALSLTENLIRRDLDSRDIIDACTALYNRYGSAKAVASETGLPYQQVLKHIKYDRLEPSLKSLVDTGEVELDVALKTQDAFQTIEQHDVEEAQTLARGVAGLTAAQRRQILLAKQRNPTIPSSRLLKDAANRGEIKQIVVTLSATTHRALQDYAKHARLTQDAAACELISNALDVSYPSQPVADERSASSL